MILTLTLFQSLQDIFGTMWGLLGLLSCLTVIALFAAAFENYEQGHGDDDGH
jgi:hypothetical protein